jgi:hypothetical protein
MVKTAVGDGTRTGRLLERGINFMGNLRRPSAIESTDVVEVGIACESILAAIPPCFKRPLHKGGYVLKTKPRY